MVGESCNFFLESDTWNMKNKCDFGGNCSTPISCHRSLFLGGFP